MSALAASLGPRHLALPLDVGNRDSLIAAAEALAGIGPFDRVIHMAAIYDPAKIADLDPATATEIVSVPALRAGDRLAALIGGMVLGLMAYGTYEFTNLATLRDWSVEQVIVDTLWGGLLTGFSAWAGVMVVRAMNATG